MIPPNLNSGSIGDSNNRCQSLKEQREIIVCRLNYLLTNPITINTIAMEYQSYHALISALITALSHCDYTPLNRVPEESLYKSLVAHKKISAVGSDVRE